MDFNSCLPKVIEWAIWIVAFCIIKFNDFSHLEAEVKKCSGKVDKLAESVAKIEGKLGL